MGSLHNKPRDHDKNTEYRNSVAWRDTKRAFGKQFGIERLMLDLERWCGDACPRMWLAVSLLHFLQLDKEGKADAMNAYYKWLEHKDDKGREGKIITHVGRHYRVIEVVEPLAGNDGHGLLALICHADEVVWLKAGLSDQEREVVLNDAREKIVRALDGAGGEE